MQPAWASHLAGGEMTYKYLGATGPATAPLRYEITVAIYNDCSGISPRPTAPVAIYEQSTGTRLVLTTVNFAAINNIPLVGLADLPQVSLESCQGPPVPPGCPVSTPTTTYRLSKYVGIVNLPATSQGYYAMWSDNARNTVTNLSGMGSQSMALYSTLSAPSLPNSSPTFVNKAIANLCLNDTTYLLNNTIDTDGDRLVYSFATPYNADLPVSFTPPPSGANYVTGYGPTTPLGTAGGNFSSINPNTGIAKFWVTGSTGLKYVVAIDVSEYRTIGNRQVLIGTTRRDIQLNVVVCPATVSPILPTSGTVPTPRNYTIEAGSPALSIPLTSTQADNHDLEMSINSVLLDGTGGYNATFGGNAGTTAGVANTVTIAGTTPGTVSGTFVFNPSCTNARATPYDLTVTVSDKGCAGKTVADILRITVTKPTGRNAIAGNQTVCGIPSQQTYTASGGTAPQTGWRLVSGGSIVGSATANPVTINWTTAGTHTLWARGISQYGCLTDSVAIQVNVGQAPTLAVTGNTTICQGASTTLSIASGATSYTVTGGGATVTGPGPFTLSPTATTVYTITAVTAGTTCGATSQVTVTVNPLPAASTGGAKTICSGGSTQIGAAATAGNTYSWSPATGLSSATAANPTVTLTNTTGAPTTQTYTLTETNSATGCVGTNTVTVTVNPPLAAAVGNSATICSGGSTQIGAAATAGNTYSWSPATGLSSATAANPTVTLTNTTGAPITQTYTLTVTDASGCTGTGSVTITVSPVPVATAGAAVAFCSGGSATLGGTAVTGLTYSWSPATGLSSATAANPTVTLTNSTGAPVTQTYTLTVTNAAGCTGTSTVVVTVNPIPVAVPGAAVAFCSGGSGQLGAASVTGLTYSWSPATGLSDPTIANPTVTLTNSTSTATTQTYTLTVTGAGNCTSTGTVVVTVNPLPTAVPGAAVAFCSGGSATLGGTAVTGLTYSWSPATGLSSATAANPTVTLTNSTSAATTQTYTLTVTNAGGCTNTGTVVVTVNPIPVAVPGAAVAFCSGGSATLGGTAVTGLTYSWSPATGLSSATAANPTVTLTNSTAAATTQTYTLTVTSAAGCTSTGTVVVTVNPLPTAVPGAAVAFCSGGSATLGGTAVTGLTYSWSPTTGLSSATAANPTVTLTNSTSAATTQTYTLTVTNAGGCTSTGTVVVTVNPLPVATAGAAVAFCSGGSGQLGAASVTGLTYSWSPATGLSSATAANPTVTLTNSTGAAVTQTYTLTTTSATGCTSTGTVVVTVNPIPVAVPGAAVAFCSGGSGQLGAASVTGLTYSWSPATGLSDPTIANPTVTLTNSTSTATTQTYTLTVTGAGNCTSTGTVVVTVNPLPTAVPGAAVAFCSGGSGQLGAASVTGLTYSWSPATGLSSATAANPTVTLTNSTGAPITQTYTLTVTSATGCASTGTVVVTVNPIPVAVPGAAVAFCSGGSGQLGAASVTGLTYSWSPATGLSDPTIANPTVTLTNSTSTATTQTYTLTVTGAGGCTSTGTVVVTVNPLPTAVPGAAVAFCSGGSATLGGTAVTGLTYSWSPATGLSSATAANPTVTLTNSTAAATTQTYTLTVTSAAGCTSTGTVVVTVNPLPVATAGAAVAICSGATGQLGATATTGNTYSWSPATGLSSATAANPTVTLTNTTGAPVTQTYTLTVTSATSCTSTGTVVVTVNPLPVALPGAAVAICSGGSATLGAAPVSGLTYSWSPATGLSSATAANPTVTLTNSTAAATTQTYTLTVTSAAGCVSTGTVAVTVTPLPVANAGAAVTICSGNTTQLGAAPVSGLTYSWSPSTGLSNSVAANPTVTLTNVSPTGTAITPTYTLTVTNPSTGCVSTATVVVTVNAEILPGIIGPNQTVCASSTPVPLASTTAPSGGYGTYTYQWESSPDNLTWTAVSGATAATYAPGPLVATIYYRRRINSGSCAEQISNAVKLELQPQLLTAVTLATPATQCAGTALVFTPVASNAGPAPTFSWYVNNTLVATSPTYTSSTLANGDVVRVEVVPTAGFCATTLAVASVTINLTPVTLPTVAIAAQTPLPACSSTAIVFAVDSIGSPGATMTYQWQVDGVSVSGATNPTYTSSTLRDGQVVTLLVTTPSACGTLTATSNPVRAIIIQNVDVEAGPDKTVVEGDAVELEGTANGNYPVIWTPSQTLTFPAGNQLRPMAAPTVTTTYTLSAKVGDCTDESKVTVTVLPRVRIPNAFSPNGDGLDDTWEIDRIAEYPNSRVVIFNRWGSKLFETTGYRRGNEWNGTINGQPAPIGTYYYLITLGNGKSYTGPLTIVY
jgi:gliding motility-associated-like protein